MSQKGKADIKTSNLTEKDFEVKEVSSDDFMKDVNEESLNNMVKAGVILPQLKPKLDIIYTVKIGKRIHSFKSEYGKAYALEIEHNKMKKQITFSPRGSFHLQFLAQLKHKNLKFSEAIGKTIVIQKTIGNTKKYNDVELYSVQFV